MRSKAASLRIRHLPDAQRFKQGLINEACGGKLMFLLIIGDGVSRFSSDDAIDVTLIIAFTSEGYLNLQPSFAAVGFTIHGPRLDQIW